MIDYNSLDSINKAIIKTTIISFAALFLSMISTTGSYFGGVIVIIATAFILFMATAYRSRITLGLMILFWVYQINHHLMNGGTFGTTVSDITMLIHLATLSFAIYLHTKYKAIFQP